MPDRSIATCRIFFTRRKLWADAGSFRCIAKVLFLLPFFPRRFAHKVATAAAATAVLNAIGAHAQR